MGRFAQGAVVAAFVLGLLAAGSGAPAFAQAKPAAKKLDFAYILAPPESGAVAFKWMAEEVTTRSSGTLNMVFHGGTLLNKEIEIMDAVKAGNVAIGCPSGAASTVFPELGVFLVPYLVRDYAHAYKMFNGEIGKSLDEQFQKKYKVKILLFFDYGFRHFWNSRRPVATPNDLKGLKLRVQQGKAFAMPFSEVIPAAQQGVIDGADLPIVNINALKIYEVSKYVSMTFHNYGPSLVVMNLDAWRSLTLEQQRLLTEVALEAQKRIREATESVDNLQKAKEILEAKGMKVNAADVPAFRKIAEERVWPQYQKQYAELWERIVGTK